MCLGLHAARRKAWHRVGGVKDTVRDPLTGSGLVFVDKPAGMTSHDVVARLRRFFGTRKVGHAGTLDPMATGVLVAGIERGTKLLAHLVTDDKVYAATIRLGQTTSTEDADGEVLTTTDTAGVTDAAIKDAVAQLTGEIMQVPSKVSAIKINGKRAHEMVRDGEEFEIPPRPITVFSFEILDIRRHSGCIDVDVRVHCSSGTYIRALARDLGDSLAVGAHLTALRREASGPFDLTRARTLEELEAHAELSMTMDEALLAAWPALEVTAEEYADLAMGKWLSPRGVRGVHAAVGPEGKVVALVKEKGARLSTTFVARPSTL
ncbi:tRNA pseudouridine(55) synthase TruB [Corynebacterium aquatimens]|nr:tRNA pseudouridine(55) synthase TruB [Corynebacterium aquatimens]